MRLTVRTVLKAAPLLLAIVGVYVLVSGTTGFCPACEAIVQRVGIVPVAHEPPDDEGDNETVTPSDGTPAGTDFVRVDRAGSVDLEEEYNTANAQIPLEEVHTLLPRDAIPALTDPAFDDAAGVVWLGDSDRVIVLEGKETAFALPLAILDMHEVVNMELDGQPIAATYCPLCDSATVISRTVVHEGEQEVLEFGVSGALYNSNVLMYDRTHKGLWSQLAMRAVTGPMAGIVLDHLPVRIRTWATFRTAHPNGKVLSRETGHERPYTGNMYARYFGSDDLLVPVKRMGDALGQKKTLGLGVLAGGESYFVTVDSIGEEVFTLSTRLGDVRVRADDGGIDVLEAPKGVHTAQAFYYSWSAFNPRTEVITGE